MHPQKTRPGQLRSGLFTNRISSPVLRHVEVSPRTVGSRWYPKYPRTRGDPPRGPSDSHREERVQGINAIGSLSTRDIERNETLTNSPVPFLLAPLGPRPPASLPPVCIPAVSTLVAPHFRTPRRLVSVDAPGSPGRDVSNYTGRAFLFRIAVC